MAIFINEYKCRICRVWWKSRYHGPIHDECPECARTSDPISWEIVVPSNDELVLSNEGAILKWMLGSTPEYVYAGLLPSGD